MMCLVLLGGVWEPIVKWRTHVFYSISTVYNLYNTPLVADILFLPFLVTKRTFSLVQASTESLVVLYVDDHECRHPNWIACIPGQPSCLPSLGREKRSEKCPPISRPTTPTRGRACRARGGWQQRGGEQQQFTRGGGPRRAGERHPPLPQARVGGRCRCAS